MQKQQKNKNKNQTQAHTQKQAPRLSGAKGRWGPDLCRGVAGTECLDLTMPLSWCPGPHRASAAPQWGPPPAPRPSPGCASRSGPQGCNTKVSWQQLRRSRLPPGGTGPSSGPHADWPGARRGVVLHSALPCGHAPRPALFLQSERRSWRSRTFRQVSGCSGDPKEGLGGARDPREPLGWDRGLLCSFAVPLRGLTALRLGAGSLPPPSMCPSSLG